jgi:Amidohydrolase family
MAKSIRAKIGLAWAALFLAGFCQIALAQGDADLAAPGETPAPTASAGSSTLFQNVRIFDGRSAALSPPSNVLVKGNIIERISTEPIPVDPHATVIAANGRTLMPGLIDAHWHAFMAAVPQPVLMTADPNYLQLLAARLAEATLMRGFTTVRDLGGPVFGLKRAIDEGVIVGPRIYPSGAFISQTSGHGDFRFSFEVPRLPGGSLSHSEVVGIAAIADSPDEVRLRDQAHGWRWRRLSLQSNRIHSVHRTGDPRRSGGRRKLGNLCHRARLYPACDSAGDRHRR